MSETTVAGQEADAAESTENAKKNVTMLEFVQAHTLGDTIADVAQATGLSPQSVQARASKYRQAEHKMTAKLDTDGQVIYHTADGGETTDKSLAKRNTQDKLQKVMIRELENGEPIVTREAINLKKFAKGGGVRLDASAANELIAKLLAESVEV